MVTGTCCSRDKARESQAGKGMIRKYVVVAVKILLMANLFSREATSFLFPDLMALRTGRHIQSRYKIAVLQEEPFLYANGTGYVPELLRLISDWYAVTKDDKDVFPYDVIPVNTWTRLLTKASATHWQVSYGLIASSLLRNEEPWKSMQASIATVQTGLKMVTSKNITKTTNIHAPTTTSTTSTTTTKGKRGPTSQSPQLESSYQAGNRIDLKGATIVTLGGSPQEHLLKKSPKYRQFNLKTVQTNEEALSYVRQHPNVFIIKDAAAARRHEEQYESELATVCPKKSLTAGAQLYYGFFGRDHGIIHFLNEALKKLRTAEHDPIKALNAKYFGQIRTCS